MIKTIFAMILLSVGLYLQQEKQPSRLVGKFVAFDKLQGLTNPREPRQQFVVEVQSDGLFSNGQFVRIIYFPPTTSIRGGAKFLGDETLSYSKKWCLEIHRPNTAGERSACSDVDTYLRAADGSIDENEKREPLLRYRSNQFKADMKFDEFSTMPCLILDSLASVGD